MGTIAKWVVIAVALVTSTVVWGITLPSLPLWSPQWVTAFGASQGAAIMPGMLIQVVGGVVLSPLAGMAVGAVSLRTLMMMGALISGLSLIAIGYASAMWQVTAIYAVLLPAGFVLCGTLITQTLAVRLFTENRGLAIGVVTAAAPICSITMPPLIGWLLTEHDWRTVQMQMGVLTLCLVPLIFAFIRETPAAAVSGDVPEIVPQPTMTTGDVMGSRIFWAVVLALVPLLIIFNAIYYNVGFLLADLDKGPAETAVMITVFGFCALPAVLTFGALADRFPQRLLLATTSTILALTFVVMALVRDYQILVVNFGVMGVCYGSLLPLLAAIFARTYGEANFARANGLFAPFLTATAVSMPLAGFARDWLGSYSAVFEAMLMLLPLTLVGLALLLRGPAAPAPASAVI